MTGESTGNSRGNHLIIGGSGFIGRHMAVALARQGNTVVIASRKAPSFDFPADVNDQISWHSTDMGNTDWSGLLVDVDTVHHYAWNSFPATAQLNPAHDLIENVVPTLRLLEAIRRSEMRDVRLIFSSSGGTAYGKLMQIPVKESHNLTPITAYGVGKVTAEHYLGLYRHLYGLDCRIARIANPYGSGQSATSGQGVATTFIARALADEEIVVWGDGGIIRDFIHISDLVTGLLAVTAAPLNIEEPAIFNLGTGHGVSIRGLLEEIQLNVEHKLKVRFELGREYDVPTSVLDTSLAASTLGWRALTSFSDGISRTVADLRRGVQMSNMDPA